MIVGISDIMAILPELIIMGSACVLLLVDFAVADRNKAAIGWLSIAAIVAAALTCCYLARNSMTDVFAFSGMFVLDDFSLFFKALFFISTVFVVLISFRYVKTEDINRGEYYILMLLSLSGMMVMASGSDLLTIYLGLELMSLPIYALVGFMRTDSRSNEGAMKYVILGAFSSAVLLFGISIIYGITGTTQLGAIYASLGATSDYPAALSVGLVMLIAGFGFKVAGVPFHMWAPDAYEGAPTPITAFMSVGAKAAAFAVVLRVFTDALYPLHEQWEVIVSVVAVLSMGVGNIVAIAQSNIKRMLAYSSIGHAGYALLGVIAGGEEGTASVMYYMLAYVFTNIGIFASVVMMRVGTQRGELISDYAGLAKKNGAAALVMLLFLFSLAGIPPFAGFVAKFYIFMALIHQGMIPLAVLAVVFSAVAAYFYIRVVMVIYMKEPEGEFSFAASPALLFVLAITVIGIIVLGIYPGYFLEIVERASVLL